MPFSGAFFLNNRFRFKPTNTLSIFVELKNFKRLFLIKFQVSILNERHHLLVNPSCKSACENLDVLCLPFATNIAVLIVVIVAAIIGVARGAKGAMPPKCLENIVILCFERRFSKQNSVIHLKSNILPPPEFFWPPPKFLGWLRHWPPLWLHFYIYTLLMYTNTRSIEIEQRLRFRHWPSNWSTKLARIKDVDLIQFLSDWLTYGADDVKQGWETFGPHEHLIWSASDFSLPVLEHNMASKRGSTISRYLESTLREVTLPYSYTKVEY